MFLPNLPPVVNKNKTSKIIKWLEWVQKLVAKRGIVSDIDSCAYGKTHLVSRAKPVGGGWMFYSKGCTGCPASKLGITLFNQDKEIPKGAPNCAILSGPLFSLVRVNNNTLINLPFTKKDTPSSFGIPAVAKAPKKLKTHNTLSGSDGSGGHTVSGSTTNLTLKKRFFYASKPEVPAKPEIPDHIKEIISAAKTKTFTVEFTNNTWYEEKLKP